MNKGSGEMMNRDKLGRFLILKSSENCYHVVFDRTVSWSENMSIVAWVSLLPHNRKIEKWLVMQCIKKESTLRISPKGNKPSPRIVFRLGEEGNEIESYLGYRKLIKSIIRNYRRSYASEADQSHNEGSVYTGTRP